MMFSSTRLTAERKSMPRSQWWFPLVAFVIDLNDYAAARASIGAWCAGFATP
jgi:hypothetical protein